MTAPVQHEVLGDDALKGLVILSPPAMLCFPILHPHLAAQLPHGLISSLPNFLYPPRSHPVPPSVLPNDQHHIIQRELPLAHLYAPTRSDKVN